MAVLDAAINNTDRKGGHILPVDGGRHIHGVDHGVCFSPVPKLRTVLWAWRGQPLAPDELEGLRRIRDGLDGELGGDVADAPRPDRGARHGPARGRAAGERALPAPLADLAGDPLAAVLSRADARRRGPRPDPADRASR